MDSERRRLFRQGVLMILLSAALGVVVGAQVPHANKWMTAHVTGLLTGVLLIGAGAAWPELRLADVTRGRAMKLMLVAGWVGFSVNIYGAIVNLPGPATEPGRAPDAPWQLIPLFAGLAVVVPSTLVSLFLVWRGLSGDGRASGLP
jgi:hypothetical protein